MRPFHDGRGLGRGLTRNSLRSARSADDFPPATRYTHSMRIVVNALPLVNVRTGIGRYVDMLYRELAQRPGIEIAYFDGARLHKEIPGGTASTGGLSLLAKAFWRLPSPLAARIRKLLHALCERRFRRLCQGFDIYHETALLPFRTPPGIKTVLTVHDLGLLRHPQWHPAERTRFFGPRLKERLPQVDGFLAVSEFTRREMGELLGIDPGRVAVSRLGIDLNSFSRPAPDQIRSVRERYSLPERYFLFVGSGDPRKNVHLVRQALRLAPELPPLAIAGWSGWDNAPTADGRELRLGYVDDADLPALYAGALAFVYPSLYEGFGLPILEAMACGCPVVTTGLASLPEVAGDAALYLDDPTNPAALASLLRRLDADPDLRRGLGEAGLAQVSKFPWRGTADTTMRLFMAVSKQEMGTDTKQKASQHG